MSLSGGPVSLALLSKRTVIGDTQRDEANRIGRLFGCSYLCLYPVVVARQVVGCIFGESQESRLALTSGELQTLEELRDSLESAIARLRRRPALGTKSAARP
jgi:GAF domain-containing protein